MKRLLALFSALIICLALSACSGSGTQGNVSDSGPESTVSGSSETADTSVAEGISASEENLGDNVVEDIWNDDGTIVSGASLSSAPTSSRQTVSSNDGTLNVSGITVSRDDSGWSEWE